VVRKEPRVAVLPTRTLVDGAGGATAAGGLAGITLLGAPEDVLVDVVALRVSGSPTAAPVPDAAGPVIVPFAEMPEFC